jgi:2-polyprenyl-3-methyl-5-hydroxy-6-metoxy-1,4-benzoquinol methylase
MFGQESEGLLSPFLQRRRIAAARPFLHGRILDVGCGSGALANIIPPENYLGVDVDEKSLSNARRLYPEHRFQSKLPFGESNFETVVSLAVIEHVLQPEDFLTELVAHLAPSADARIVLTTPHPAVACAHSRGARLGLFSQHASKEHKLFLDRSRLELLANACNLHLLLYRRFLLGANQLAVLKRKTMILCRCPEGSS